MIREFRLLIETTSQCDQECTDIPIAIALDRKLKGGVWDFVVGGRPYGGRIEAVLATERTFCLQCYRALPDAKINAYNFAIDDEDRMEAFDEAKSWLEDQGL